MLLASSARKAARGARLSSPAGNPTSAVTAPGGRLALYEGPLRNARARLVFLPLQDGGVFHALLLPYRHEGWFMIVCLLHASEGETDLWCAAVLSDEAIRALTEMRPETSPVKTIATEMFDWSYAEMIRNRNRPLIIPTVRGCFCGRWDEADSALVLTTWLPDRVLNESESGLLARLRQEKHLLVGERLAL
jgi:hypothetical protein